MMKKANEVTPMGSLEKVGLGYVLTIPILAGMSMFTFEIDGFNYTGYLWTAQYVMGVGLLGFAVLAHGITQPVAKWGPWLAWCGLLMISLFWTQDIDRRVFQDVAQLTMPILVGMVAAATIRSRTSLTRLLQVFWIPLICVGVFTKHYAAEVSQSEWQWVATPDGYSVRSTALAVALIGCIFLAAFPRRILVPLGVWAACILIATVTSSRMAALVLLAAPVLHPLYPSKRWNVTLACGVAVIGLALFFTPMFQQHFFESGRGSISDLSGDEFMDNGRFFAWSQAWDEALEHPLLGSGVGSINAFVSRFWEGISVVHNDYLRIFFEIGIVGVTAFATLIFWQMRTLYQLIHSSDGIVRTAFAAVWLGFIALLMSSLTDNTITYHIYFTNPLFAILGTAYGVFFAEHQPAQAGFRLADTLAAPAVGIRFQQDLAFRQR